MGERKRCSRSRDDTRTAERPGPEKVAPVRAVLPVAAKGLVLVLEEPGGPRAGQTDIAAAVKGAGFEVLRPHLRIEDIEEEVRRSGVDLVLVRFEYKDRRGAMVATRLGIKFPGLPVVPHSDGPSSVRSPDAIGFRVQHQIHDTRKVSEHVEGLEHLVRAFRAGVRWRRHCEALRSSAVAMKAARLNGPFDLSVFLQDLEAAISVAIRRERTPGEAAGILGMLPRRFRQRAAAACGQSARDLPGPRGAVDALTASNGPGRILLLDDREGTDEIAPSIVGAIEEAGHHAIWRKAADDPVQLVLDEGVDLALIHSRFRDTTGVVHAWSLKRAMRWLPLLLYPDRAEARTDEVTARLGLEALVANTEALVDRLRGGMIADGIEYGRAGRAGEVWRRETVHDFEESEPGMLDLPQILLDVRNGIAEVAFDQHERNCAATARFLGVDRRTLGRWIGASRKRNRWPGG